MSIFLEIIQMLLIPKIDELDQDSQRADESYLNSVRGMIGYGRNAAVAKEKRRQLQVFKTLLNELTDHDPVSDDAMLRTIKTGIDTCMFALKAARSTELFFPESNMDKVIRSLSVLVEEIYAKMNVLKVLNIIHSKDPLAIFQYHIAYYCAKKITDSMYLGVVDQIAAHPWVAQTGKLTASKEHFIMHHTENVNGTEVEGIIPICQKKLADVTEQYAALLGSRQQVVLAHMTHIQLMNRQFYTRHSVDPLSPPAASLFDRAYDASVSAQGVGGLLGQCLLAAASEIHQFCQHTEDNDMLVIHSLSGV